MNFAEKLKNGSEVSYSKRGTKQQQTMYFNDKKHGLEFWFRNHDELLYVEKWSHGESTWEIGFNKSEQFTLDSNIELFFYPVSELV